MPSHHHPHHGDRHAHSRSGRGGWHAGPRGKDHDGFGPAPLGPDGGRRRVFDGGELKLVLLKLVEEQPRHGYDLIREIEARSGDAYAPSPGVIYPTLTLLADMGLIEEAKAEGARRLFAINEDGRRHLVERQADVETALARLDALATFSRKTGSAPIRRAMQNLKTALHQRLSEDGVDKNTSFDIAGLIDEVARKIERL